jgi:hypothetical protein
MIVASIVSMAAGYGLVQHLARDSAAPVTPAEILLSQGATMRSCSNDLVALTTEFLNESTAVGAAGQDRFKRWCTESYQPRLNDLRRRMLATADNIEGLDDLLAASDAVAVMAAHPERENLRTAAIEDVLQAATQTETRIAAMGVSRFLSEPARLPHLAPGR